MFDTLKTLSRDRHGGVAVLVTLMLPVLLGVVGLSVDVGLAYVARRQLQETTQAAALAGAAALSKPGATTVTVGESIAAWQKANTPSGLAIGKTTTSLACDSATAGLPGCNAATPNVVKVTQTASLPTTFLKVVGKEAFDLSVTVSAAKAGGEGRPINLMIVLDVTGSMLEIDTTCAVGKTVQPTKMQCAMYAIQKMLKVMPTAYNKVGLMVFPGMASQWRMTSYSCGTGPDQVPYFSPGIQYQIGTTLDDTYNDGAGNLLPWSPLVTAVGIYPSKVGCLENLGPVKLFAPGDFSVIPGVKGGSYAAEVLQKAQAAFPIGSNAQNVIVYISDGDLSTTYISALSYQWDKFRNQCAQAVDAAKAATAAGTMVYSIAWGALNNSTGCLMDFDRKYNPCSEMKAAASDASKFYTTTQACQNEGSPNAVGDLPTVLGALANTLSKPRLLLSQ